jgi:hypothetical protein
LPKNLENKYLPCQKSERNSQAHLASLFSIVANGKILLLFFSAEKEMTKKGIIIQHLATEPAQVL